MSAALLVRALRDPASVTGLSADAWAGLIAAARAEQLAGTLAERLHGLPLPDAAARIMADARFAAGEGRRAALWEAEAARRALAGLGVPVILLKGTAYAAAGLDAAQGRAIGDLDILVPRAAIDQVEAALLAAGWEWVKPDPYDDAYYRRWMHELPPLIHRARDRMIDAHHTILPPTARPTPDADALVADARPIGEGLHMLSCEDMVIHAAAHLIADGDLSGGLRNLWDIDRLVRAFDDDAFWPRLAEHSRLHGLTDAVARALRLAERLYATPVAPALAGRWRASDALFARRLLARDGWGRPVRPLIRLGFYGRSHWLRMPPALLARHLWTKWRRRG